MEITTREIEIGKLRTNDGRIEGLPKNPRKISRRKLEQLKKSVQDAPEMLRLRELIAVENNGEFVVIAGNQRLEAAKAIGMESVPVKVLPSDTPAAKLREYAIKDNLPFGEDDWEILKSDWDVEELEEWGMDVKKGKESESDDMTLYDSPIQLLPAAEYILIICDDGFEFDEAREHFGLGYIRKNNIRGENKIAKARTIKWKDYVNSNTFKGKTVQE